MITWLKIILTVAFIYTWFSVVGIAIAEFLKIDVKKYYFPIGFIAILGIYEIIMYYPIMFAANRIYSLVAISIFIVLAFLYTIFRFKKIVNNIFTLQTLYIVVLVLIGFVMLYFLNPLADTKNDIDYYLSIIRSANEGEVLGMINSYQSGWSMLGGNHLLYGFYYFVGHLSKFVRLDPYVFSVWINPLIYVMFVAGTNLLIVDKLIKDKNTKMIAAIFAVVNALFLEFLEFGIYGNIYKVSIFALMYIFLKDYKKSVFKKTLSLFVISAASLAVHQSSVFLLVGVIVSYFIYCSFYNNNELPFIFLWAIPTVFNGLFIYGYYVKILSAAYLALVDIVLIVWILKQKIVVNVSKFGSFIAPIVILIASLYIELFGNPNVDFIHYFDIAFNFNVSDFGWAMDTIANYINILFIVAILVMAYKKNHLSFYTVLVITGVFFYSYLTVGFVSTYMARGVYDRMGELILAPILIMIFLIDIKSMKATRIFLIAEILLFAIWPFALNNKISDDNYNHLYRAEKDLVEVARDVDKHAEINPTAYMKIFSTNLTAHSFTKNLNYVYTMGYYRNDFDETKDAYDENKKLTYILSTKSDYFEDDEYNPELVCSGLYTMSSPYFIVGTDQRKELYENLDKECQRISTTGRYIGYYCEFDYIRE